MGDLDVSIVADHLQILGHPSRVLWHEWIYAAFPADHDLAGRELLTWGDLRGEAFIVSRGGPGAEIQYRLMRELSCPGFRPLIEIHDVSRGSLLDLVAMGYGITIASTSALKGKTDNLAFRPIAGEHDVIPAIAVRHASNTNPALQELLQLADKVIRTSAGSVR